MVSDADPRAREAAGADLLQAVLRAASDVLPPGPGGGDPLPVSRDLIEESHEPEEGLRLVAGQSTTPACVCPPGSSKPSAT